MFGPWHRSAFACGELLPLYRGTAADADPGDGEGFRRLLREHIAVYAPDPSGARFLDKTHAYTVKVPLLARLLAGAEPVFVVVLRTPYSTCRWALERKPPAFRVRLSARQGLRLIADHWANAHATVLEDAGSVADVVAVRFEDFLADPEAVVRALCDAVRLDYDPQMVPRAGQRLPCATLSGDRKWYPLYSDDRLDAVTIEERSIVDERCGRLAARFGYRPDGRDERSALVELLSAAR
jgi:hypothetical protein